MDNLLSTNNGSLARVLLIFYVLVASSFTTNLMGKQLKTFLSENRIAQHVIAFIMMLVLIIVIGNVNDIKKAFAYSLLGYLWFIFTTKLDIQWNLIIIFALIIIFMYENNMIEKEKLAENDINLSNNDKILIKQRNDEVRNYTIIGVIVVTLVGMYLYLTKKEDQYGGGKFDLIKFVFY